MITKKYDFVKWEKREIREKKLNNFPTGGKQYLWSYKKEVFQ